MASGVLILSLIFLCNKKTPILFSSPVAREETFFPEIKKRRANSKKIKPVPLNGVGKEVIQTVF